MAEEFTKQEALVLFDQKIRFKRTLYFEAENLKFPIIEEGTVARVCLIENTSGQMTVTFLIDEDFQAFDKTMFNYHCEIVEPCSVV